jgi:hypothetical protein
VKPTEIVKAARVEFAKISPQSAKEAELTTHIDQLTDNLLIAAKNLEKEAEKHAKRGS